MISNTPELASILNMCRGRSFRDFFYSKCKEENVNPEDVLNSLR